MVNFVTHVNSLNPIGILRRKQAEFYEDVSRIGHDFLGTRYEYLNFSGKISTTTNGTVAGNV